MKRIIFLCIAFCLSLIVVGQTASHSIKTGNTYLEVTTNYTLTNTTPDTIDISAPQHYPTTQDFTVNLDSVSGNHTNVAVALYGQKSAVKADWTQIGSTVNWKGTTSDTTIVLSNATANRYRSYRIIYTGTGTGVSRIDNQELKLYIE